MLHIFKDLYALSQSAAGLFVALANQAVTERGRFLVALSGGGTPKRLFKLLASMPDTLDWALTHVFWADERLVPENDPESNYGMTKQILFDNVPIPVDNVHRVNPALAPAEAVADYILTLKRFASPPLDWPCFDLVLLGMGDDGHTASLFPGSPVEESAPVIAVTADYQGRPANRVTLTPFVLNNAREIFFMVAGASKAEALKHVLNNDSALQYPAARIQPIDGTVTWLVDEATASALTPGLFPDHGRGEK